MARNWRIRHKLMLGMSLVVAIMALLLWGTLNGIAAFRQTVKTFDSKLLELKKAEELRGAVKLLLTAHGSAELFTNLGAAREALKGYRAQLQNTIDSGRDPENGHQEKEEVKALEQQFDSLEEKLKDSLRPSVTALGSGQDIIAEGTSVRKEIDKLIVTTGDLVNILTTELRDRIEGSRSEHRTTVAVLIGSSSGAVVLMASLLLFFYRWVVRPLRTLERGVQRVARGEFEHRIEIKSGDELQDLADAFNDMTGRLRAMYTNLAQQVNERSRQLVRSERLAGVGFLAAGVAHEINNPLASIMFYSEALERRLADLLQARAVDPEERALIAKYLKVVQEEAERCKGITSRLLSFSRGGDRKREHTDLAEVIQGVLDMVQHLPSCKGKHLIFDHRDDLTGWVNAQEVKQVFLNLVVNALDSMDDSGTLTISHARRAGLIELVFKDTGCGMTADVLENIFEPFFTRSRTGKGTGLGLSISHRIITQHGGEIEAVSDGPGQGSTFVVRLPVEAPAAGGDGSAEEVLDPEQEFLKLSSARQERKVA